ncbi:MAG: SAM-dependent methyltransferase [Candidatus Lokiarchaeota archaeon]|nr:SAM-dependent methyltransferase [Candidatus Lokiarchaeota archaeon]
MTNYDEKYDKIDESTAMPFTARLMAYYRAQESQRDNPLIIDPHAEKLAGDLKDYLKDHIRYSQMDYAIVRSYYIEEKLLKIWCEEKKQSQIVMLGAGLDTRAYRFKPFKINDHIVFEIDLPVIIKYKKRILRDEIPLCKLVQISGKINKCQWLSKLMNNGFSSEIPSFWILEGVIFYMEKQYVSVMLEKIADISAESSQIFADINIPILSEIKMGPFTRHFKWGLELNEVSSFFKKEGWKVKGSYADNFDQGRDVGQRGMIFINGKKI